MARFFINRPVFAWVVAILISLWGVLAITQLPVAQYPTVAPPSISVTARYAGASAETLQDTVTSVIEQQMNGIDHLLYMQSTSDATGTSQVTLYFEPGTDPDTAQVQVQNKVQLATPSLPQTVQQQGITVAKATRNFLMFIALSTDDGSMDQVEIGNYVSTRLLDSIRRVNGVGEAMLFGTEYAMRVWLNPDQLENFKLSPGDVVNALQAQNAQVPVGQLGDLPAVDEQQLNVILQGRSTLNTPEEFGRILLRVEPDGSRVTLADVARIELAGQSYATLARVNGQPSAAMAIRLAPGANAMQTAEAVRQRMDELSEYFPAGMQINYPLDTSAFVEISIHEVVKTLIEAIVLVFLVMFLFLQNLRTTFIPTIVVPVALLGTFGIMWALGFSINVLTMFGMVLAIGILVDDAIVVVENVERIMSEEALGPVAATRKAMGQITGALVGIGLVLTAVFIPMAFFPGSVGNIYRQFSLALAASMVFSVFLALSLTPALCATFLKASDAHGTPKRGFFGWFNRNFESGTKRYQSWVARLLKHSVPMLAAYLAIIVAVGWIFVRMPSSFLPEEDQGYFITNIQLPAGATFARTDEVLKQVESYYAQQPEIDSFITVAGFSFSGRGQNSALAFVRLKDWAERTAPGSGVDGVIGRAFGAFSRIKDAIIYPVNPPPISELGNASGFNLMLQDRAALGHDALMDARNQLLGLATKDPRVTQVRVQGLEDVPQLQIVLDEEKASAMGVSSDALNTTLSTALGSRYVNNFVNDNRVQRVLVHLDAPYRMSPEDIGRLFVRNASGEMVPISAVASLRWTFGSAQLQSYNGFPAVNIVGSAAPGRSTGEAMDAIEEMIKQLPAGIGYEWTGLSYEEKLSGSQAPMLFTLSVLVVFLCLAALYESWSIPFAVILVIPLGILGALLAAELRGMPNDIYFKVGLLATVGLSTKNAILIIEFAKEQLEAGTDLLTAILTAVRLRLRPILMTSMAFILGVTPLAIAHGAGSASQNAIGTGVAGGMLAGTILAIFFVPTFFFVVSKIFRRRQREPEESISLAHSSPSTGATGHE